MKRLMFIILGLSIILAAVLIIQRVAHTPSDFPRVIVLGLDGLDYDFIRNRSNQAFMPRLTELMLNEHTMLYREQPTRPVLSPIIWTSMVTGASPTRHDILDFFSYDTGKPLPIGTADRKIPAIWNILSEKKARNLCVGTYISYPAEVLRGIYVSDDAFTRDILDSTSIYPEKRVPDIESRIQKDMKKRGDWITSLEPFSDRELKSNVEKVFHVSVAKLELFRALLEEQSYHFAMTYIEGTDEVGHYLSHLWPTPIMDDQAELSGTVSGAVPAYFSLVDQYIGAFYEHCRDTGTWFVIVSDHGFRWQNNRPASLPYESEHAASWHSENGVFLIYHKALLKKSLRLVNNVSIYDLFPTLMDIYELPHASYEMGASLLDKEKGETVDYSKVIDMKHALVQTKDDPEFVKHLVALGYLRGGSNLNNGRYYNNLGVTLDQEERYPKAIRAFEAAIKAAPDNPNPYYNLSMVYFKTREWDRFLETFRAALDRGLQSREQALANVLESLFQMGEVQVLERLMDLETDLPAELLDTYRIQLAKHFYEPDPERSLRWLNRVSQARTDCNLLFLKATCYLKLGNPGKAASVLREHGCQRELSILARGSG